MLRETTHCLNQQSRSLNRRDKYDQERVTPVPQLQSEKNRMACAKRSKNQRHQPLGQVRGDREEHSNAIDSDQSEFTVNRELSQGHGSSD